MISVAHAQNAFGKFYSLHAGQFSEITSPHFLFAGANDVIDQLSCLLRCMRPNLALHVISRRRRNSVALGATFSELHLLNRI